MTKPSLRARLLKAAQALRGADPSPGLDTWAHSTVRAQDAHAMSQRRVQMTHADLCRRWLGTVKVAGSRNAQAVASLPIRLMRRAAETKPGGVKWESRPLSRKSMGQLRTGECGRYAHKAASRFGEVEEIVDPQHPVLKLLAEANPIHNGFELMEMTQAWIGLAGDAYWYVARGSDGEPVEIWPLAPQFTRAVPSQDRVIGAYVYGAQYDNEQIFQPEDIVHFKNVHPSGNPYHGMGDLEACVREADLNSKFVEFGLAMLDNGAQPGVIVSGRFPTEDVRARAELTLNRKQEGVHNAGRSMVINGEDVTVTPNNLSEKEIAFLTSADRMDLVIAACHDMPIAILRLETAALATAKAAVPQWQMMAIRPRARKIEDIINQKLIRQIFGLEDVFVVMDDPLGRDMEALSTRIVAEWNAGLLTKNEARNELGRDDTEEGGDEFKAEPEPFGGGGLGGFGKEGDGAEGAKKPAGGDRDDKSAVHTNGKGNVGSGCVAVEPNVDVVGITATGLLHAKSLPSCCTAAPRLIRKDDRAGQVIRASELELEALLRRFFNGLNSNRLVSDAGLYQGISGDQQLIDAFLSITRDPLGKLYLNGWNAGAMDLSAMGMGGANGAFTEAVEAHLRKFQGRLQRSVFETVDSRLGTALADGVAAGDGLTGLRDRVDAELGGIGNVASERIARTESTRAFLSAREGAWEAIGGVKEKRWLLSSDPCPICQTMAQAHNTAKLGEPFLGKGATISLIGGGTFTNDYADMDTPPAHPQCRCSMVAVFEE